MLIFGILSLYLVGVSAFILPPLSKGDGRIIGGVVTTIEDRPFSASLQEYRGNHFLHICGAVILNSRYLLSAAHCIMSDGTTLYARVGSTEYHIGGQLREVTAFIQHPLYNRTNLDHDVAVLRLSSDLVFGTNVAPVILPSLPDPVAGEITTVSGWGLFELISGDSNTRVDTNLRKVDLPVFDQDRCHEIYSQFLTPRHICLGGTPQGGTGVCFGDSGGPATYNGTLIGTVSGGFSCSAPNVPALYARISFFVDWIKENAEMN